jgi:hypothetical protein
VPRRGPARPPQGPFPLPPPVLPLGAGAVRSAVAAAPPSALPVQGSESRSQDAAPGAHRREAAQLGRRWQGLRHKLVGLAGPLPPDAPPDDKASSPRAPRLPVCPPGCQNKRHLAFCVSLQSPGIIRQPQAGSETRTTRSSASPPSPKLLKQPRLYSPLPLVSLTIHSHAPPSPTESLWGCKFISRPPPPDPFGV